MLADALTKEKPEPHALLRACIKAKVYQLADEPTVLQHASQERERREARRQSENSVPVATVTCIGAMVGFTPEVNSLQVRSLLEGLAQADDKGVVVATKTHLRSEGAFPCQVPG